MVFELNHGFFPVEKIDCTQNHDCVHAACSIQILRMRAAFECALAGLSVRWADRTLTTSMAQFGAQQVGPEHQDAEVVLADPLDGSATLTNTNAAGKIVLMQRSDPGGCSFITKALHAQNAGAVAPPEAGREGTAGPGRCG